jgi:hypothetical protein
MLDVNHKDDLRHCKLRSKSWNGESCRPRKTLRPRKSVFTSNENSSTSLALSKAPCCRTISSPSKLTNHSPWISILLVVCRVFFCKSAIVEIEDNNWLQFLLCQLHKLLLSYLIYCTWLKGHFKSCSLVLYWDLYLLEDYHDIVICWNAN